MQCTPIIYMACIQKVLGSIPSWVPYFFFRISLLFKKAYHLLKNLQCDYLVFSSVSLVV